MDVDGAADVLFQGTVDVPFENRFWRRPLQRSTKAAKR